MNIFILLLGVLLVVLSSIAIFVNSKRKNLKLEEGNIANDINKVISESVEDKTEFETVLNDVNNQLEIDLNQDIDYRLISNQNNKNLIIANDKSNIQDKYESQEEIIDNDRDYVFNKIIELSRSGLKVEEIAKVTKKGIREVEIILKIHSNKSN